MKYSVYIKLYLSIWLILCSADAASAEPDIDYMLGLSVGLRGVEFDFTSMGGTSFFTLNDGSGVSFPVTAGADLEFGFEETLYTAVLNGAVIYDRFHVSAALELPVQAEETALNTRVTAQPGPGQDLSGAAASRTELDRLDLSVTLGYRVWEGFSIFSGYKYTEFDLRSREYNFILDDKNQNYVEQGLFLGGSYAWKIGTLGSVSLSVAYANLDADYSESNVAPRPPAFGSSVQEFAYSGNATGLSYGAQWNGRLSNRWLYTINLKRQSYKSNNNATALQLLFDEYFLSQDPEIPIPVTSSPIAVTAIDSEHTDTIFSVGVLYVF